MFPMFREIRVWISISLQSQDTTRCPWNHQIYWKCVFHEAKIMNTMFFTLKEGLTTLPVTIVWNIRLIKFSWWRVFKGPSTLPCAVQIPLLIQGLFIVLHCITGESDTTHVPEVRLTATQRCLYLCVLCVIVCGWNCETVYLDAKEHNTPLKTCVCTCE